MSNLSQGDKIMLSTTAISALATVLVWYMLRGKRVL